MCDLCGEYSAVSSWTHESTGRLWNICLTCDRMKEDNKSIFVWMVKIQSKSRDYVDDVKIKTIFEVHQIIKQEVQEQVRFQLLSVEPGWIERAQNKNGEFIRSEVQKVLFVDGLGAAGP